MYCAFHVSNHYYSHACLFHASSYCAHRITPNWLFCLIPFQSHTMKLFKEGTVLLQK